MKLVMTELAGMIRRGKYILVMSFWLPIKLLLLSVSALEKNCHGNKPANTIIA